MVTGPDPPGHQPRWPAEQHLRSWLADLDQHGELGRVRSRISPDQEVAAVLERTDGRRAVLFSEVAGARFALAGNLVLGRAGLARAIGCAPGEVADRYAAALATARPCVAVPPGSAPVLGHRLDPDQPLSGLPVTVQHERDAGRYLTAALLVVRDPKTGRTNLSINRMLVVDGARLRALLLPGRLRAVLAESERRHHNLPVAIVVGVDPLLGLASQAPGHLGLDDLEVASALRATPLPVVHAPTTGLPVPADAEFVLEGRFLANVREPEGPFGEFPRTYGPAGPAPVIEVAAGWHRETPMFQTILPGGREHFLLGGVPREAILLRALRQAGFDVSGVRLPESGSCRLQAVVALRDPAPGMAVNAMLAMLGIATTVKWAVVVDDDVDIFDDEQVGWAIATRVQADRDVIVVPGAGGSGLDPSARDGVTAKLGVDATVPRGDRDRYARIRVGTRDRARLAGYLAELGYPEGGPA